MQNLNLGVYTKFSKDSSFILFFDKEKYLKRIEGIGVLSGSLTFISKSSFPIGITLYIQPAFSNFILFIVLAKNYMLSTDINLLLKSLSNKDQTTEIIKTPFLFIL